ncbi:MAG: hypothetical protein LBV13_06290 [Methanomassiliicoccaceae archaeon]|jgi:hypothetical protein|nr:hypothetical protein [Methanomassiliicoccaceae archaeon]
MPVIPRKRHHMRSNTVLTVIFAVIVAAVLIGEVYVYTQDQGRYSSDVTFDAENDRIDYSVTSKGSEQYSVIVSDNGGFGRVDNYYIYYDAEYGSRLEKVQVPVGARELTQEYHISQLITMLNNRSITEIEMLNATELEAMMTTGGSPASKGLIILSGAFPDTVYTGEPTDPVFNWINAGGSLYWAGNVIGAYIARSNGTVEEVPDGEGLFGLSPLSTSPEKELSDITTNDYRHSLSLMNNSVRYGVNTKGLTDHLAIGYTDGTYSSSVLLKVGDGMICVVAGDHSIEQRHDLAQIIASGICYRSTEEGYAEGEVKKGTAIGNIDVILESGNNYAVYIYFGGYYTVYGKITEVIP